MGNPQSTSATIRLAADKLDISLADIVNALYDTLRRENGYIFSGLGHHRPRLRTGDFRDSLMSGLVTALPQDESEHIDIKRILTTDLERQRQRYSEQIQHLKGEYLASASRVVASMQCKLDSMPDTPLSKYDMHKYAEIMAKARIREMLDDDIANGQLVVSSADGKQVVLLDNLVAWAIFRKILVEQDAFPGCRSFAEASYQRLHQHLSEEVLSVAPQVPPAASDNPPISFAIKGITTRQIDDAFGALVKFGLSKAMTDKAKWTKDARLTSGTKGGKHKSLWNPVVLATALHEEKKVPMMKLNQAFNTHAFLADWREEWNRLSTM